MTRPAFTFLLFLNLVAANAFAARSLASGTRTVKKSTKSSVTSAKKSGSPYITQKWFFVLNDAGADMKSSTTVLKRLITVGDVSVPVASITHSIVKREKVLPDSEAKKEAVEIAQSLRKAMGSPAWLIDCNGNRCVFGADWIKQNRFVQIVYRNLGDRYAFSISSTRRIYGLPIADEARFVQLALANMELKKQASAWDLWKSKFIAFFGSSEQANAADFNVMIPGVKDPIKFSGNISDGDVKRIQDLIGSANNGIKDAGDTAKDVINAGRNSANNVVNNAVDRSQAAAKNTIDYGYNKAIDAEKQSMRDANALIEKATSFKKVFETAFAAGAGGALGVAVTNAVINFVGEGGAEIVSSLWHSIMGTLTEADKELMRKSAGTAFKDLEASSAELTRVEIEIDKRIAALSLVEGMPAGDLADQVGTATELQAQKYDSLQQLLRSRPLMSQSAFECAAAASQAKGTLETLKQVSTLLVGEERSPEGVCAKVNDLLRNWSVAEARVNQARETIAKNSAIVLAQITKNFTDAHKDIGSSRRDRNTCKENFDQMREQAREANVSVNCIQQLYQRYQYSPANRRDEAFEGRARNLCQQAARASINASIRSMNSACDEAIQIEESRDHTASLQNGLMLANANVEAAKDAIAEMSRKDCDQGVTTNGCDGKAGSFARLRQRYQHLYEVASRKCGDKMFRPKAFEPVALPEIAPPGASDSMAVPPIAGADSADKPSWLGAPFRAVGSFFNWVGSGFGLFS
jgi:hypothetical protein